MRGVGKGGGVFKKDLGAVLAKKLKKTERKLRAELGEALGKTLR